MPAHCRVTFAPASSLILCRQAKELSLSQFLLQEALKCVCPHPSPSLNCLYRATVTSAWLPHELWIIPRDKHWAKKLLGPVALYAWHPSLHTNSPPAKRAHWVVLHNPKLRSQSAGEVTIRAKWGIKLRDHCFDHLLTRPLERNREYWSLHFRLRFMYFYDLTLVFSKLNWRTSILPRLLLENCTAAAFMCLGGFACLPPKLTPYFPQMQ